MKSLVSIVTLSVVGLLTSLASDASAQLFRIPPMEDIFSTFGRYNANTGEAGLTFNSFDVAPDDTRSPRSSSVDFRGLDGRMRLTSIANDPSAMIRVQNIGESTGIREMFRLVNNGGSLFSFEDTNLGQTWFFSSNSIGDFNVSLSGTGGAELNIRRDGRVIMGPGRDVTFDLLPSGDLLLGGALYEASDRNLKDNFVSVDESDVLEKINQMPVTSWQYKKDDNDARHIGPTAQDFHRAFGLGVSDKKIATVDGVGVSLVAIKALSAEVEDKDQQIAALKEQLERQAQQLGGLASRLDSLESKE